MNIINYNYKGSNISFMNGNNVMVNATQMAKPFGKQPIHWLTNQSTKDFLDALSKLRNLSFADNQQDSAITRKSGIAHNQSVNTVTGIPVLTDNQQVVSNVGKSHISENQLVIVKKGSAENGGGTWMHEDVALEFARWLNPAFAIWCNDRIKELLRTGVATVSNDDEAIAYAMQVLNKRLEQSRAEKEMLEQQNIYLINEVKEAAPKVKCYNEYISSDGTYTTTQIAKEYGWGAETLNKKLASMGIQYKQNRQWILYAKYDGKGYTKSKPVTYSKSDGTTGTQMQTVWTSKGREFIHSIFAS